MTVHAEISEPQGNKIRVDFDFDYDLVLKAKSVVGWKFVSKQKSSDGCPHWLYSLDIDVCHQLRNVFGEDLKTGRNLRKWYERMSASTKELVSLATSDDADLERLPDILPRLYDFVSSRPYQRADIKFMAINDAPANTNQPGLGKTIEYIGSVFEGELDEGPNLVAAPLSSLEVVWEWELDRWQHHPILVATGDRANRNRIMKEALWFVEEKEPFWLIVNPAMVQYKRSFKKCDYHKKKKAHNEVLKDCVDCEEVLTPNFEELFDIEWGTFCLDEFHMCGLTNTSTLTSKAMGDIKAGKKTAMSGTPMRGKPIKLFGMLHFLRPDEFPSKWKFADQWLEVADSAYGKTIGGIQMGREEAFFQMLSRYVIRRTKAEVLKQLPPKDHQDRYIKMEKGTLQRRQYKQFELETAVKIEDMNLTATSILAEYTRLKQFADSAQDVQRVAKRVGGEDTHVLELYPRLGESNKLPYIEEILNELGINPEDPEGDEQVVIFSQFSRMVDMVHKWLNEKKYPVEKLTGSTSQAKRTQLVRQFQDPVNPLRVLVMTTTAGGVAITLDRASTVIFMDETWVPDEQEQAEDRVHRGSRMHQVTVYYLRSKGTIEEMIADRVREKADLNELVLDIRRQMISKKEED